MFVRRFLLPLAAAALWVVPFAQGDTVKFKNPQRKPIQGKVLSQNASSVTIEWNRTPTVKDISTFPMTEVEEVVISKPEDEAFDALKLGALETTPDLLSEADYTRLMQPLEKFLEQYPNYPEAAKVRATIEQLGQEKKQVAGGAKKIDQKWIGRAEYEQNKYNFDARAAEKRMELLIADGEFLEALRAFLAIEKDFPNAVAFPNAILDYRRALDGYEDQLEEGILRHPVITKDRERDLQGATPADRKIAEDAIAKEAAAVEEKRKMQKDAKAVWLDTYRYELRHLEEAKQTVEKERDRVAKYNVSGLSDIAKLTEQANKHLADGQYQVALITLQRAIDLMGNKNSAYHKELLAEIEEKKAAFDAANQPPPTEVPAPSTEMRKDPKDDGKDKGKEEKPAKDDKAEGSGKNEAPPKPDKKPAKKDTEKKPRPAPSADGGDSGSGGDAEEGGSNLGTINLILFGIGAVLLVVMIVANQIYKRSARDESDNESVIENTARRKGDAGANGGGSGEPPLEG